MGRFRVSIMRKFLQRARVSVSGLGKPSRPGPAQCHALFRLERSVHVLFDPHQLVFLEPQKLRSILIRHTHEVATQKLHISTYSSCCGIEPTPHHEDFEGFTFDLDGFDHNEEVVSHASRQAVTISNTALRKLLIGGESDHHRDDPSSHEGTTHDSEPLCDPSGSLLANDKASSCDPDPSCSRETTHASTPNSHKDDIMSFLKDCFEPIPSPEAALFINDAFFPLAALAFQSFFLQNCSQELRKQLQDLEPSDVREKVLFPMFVEFCTRQFPGEMIRFQALIRTADMTKPHALFPPARAIKRKIIYHHGPTNSGKTYNALQRFLHEPNGIYCSPLRLLAMEVYDYANGKGVLCSLITGQEKKEVPFSNHVSCTVEMSSMQQVWKVAVIDEVQLLNDDNRGWAWTRALLGLQAEEIHLCGDPSALPVVRSMCSATGDELEEYAYERFKPLAVDTDTLGGDFGNVQPGDCIVTFSRREIFEIKRAVERATHKRCCVVYGALPPETRAQQAKLFNEPNNGYDILVASDAVGMGLNLNIRRVVFHTLEKFDGELRNRIPVSLTKQIAGRAGRRGSLYPEGLVTTFHVSDLPHLLTCLEEPFAKACSAGLFPSCEQLQLFAEHMPEAKFSKLLERFVETSRVDSFYFLCQNRGLRKVASVIDTVDNLTLEERFTFCFSPVNARSQKSMGALLQHASSYSRKLPLQLLVGKPSWSPGIDFQLMDLEEKYQLLSLYLWLSQHFPAEFFPQKQEAVSMSLAIARTLGQSLTDLHN